MTLNGSFVRQLVVLYLFSFTCLAACNASDVADPNVAPNRDSSPAQTDSLVYHLVRSPNMYRAYVVATYTNRTSSPVSFVRCTQDATTPMYGIRRTGPDSTARLFVDLSWACVGGVPNGTIAPGASVTVRMPVGSFDQPQMTPPLQKQDIVGLMRMDFGLCQSLASDVAACKALPAEQRQSNAFLVVY